MEPSTATAKVVRFGIFELDAESGELRRHGLKIRLPEQSFQILRLLIARPGEVVTREELRQQLWTPDTFVDFDVGMNSAIRKLREALDDSAENPRFVETLPRRGYRFIAPMKPLRPNPVPGSVASGTIVSSQFRRPWIAGGFVVAVAVAGLFLIYERGWDRLGEGPGAAPIRSLAVLPFENLTGDTAQDYVGDGMTDALTTDLAQIAGLQVISRTSAMQYKGAKKPVPVIAKELNVDALVDGAITRSGQQFRITAQLIHGATDRHLWAQRYDGEMRDALSLQKQMAEAIAAAIGRPLAPTGGAQRPRDINPAAYDAYLKGVSRGGQGRTKASARPLRISRRPLRSSQTSQPPMPPSPRRSFSFSLRGRTRHARRCRKPRRRPAGRWSSMRRSLKHTGRSGPSCITTSGTGRRATKSSRVLASSAPAQRRVTRQAPRRSSGVAGLKTPLP